jgi:hypothetical protein
VSGSRSPNKGVTPKEKGSDWVASRGLRGAGGRPAPAAQEDQLKPVYHGETGVRMLRRFARQSAVEYSLLLSVIFIIVIAALHFLG